MTYLGETIVEQADSPFKDYKAKDWAEYWLVRCGGYDGDHHKAWVIDQAIRSLKGCCVIIKKAEWDTGLVEWRVSPGCPSQDYIDWRVSLVKEDYEDDPDYEGFDFETDWRDIDNYNEGVAP